MIAVGAGSVLVWATDPTPTAGEIVFDYIAGQVDLVFAGIADLITGSLAETFADATVAADGTFTDPAPDTPPVVDTSASSFRMPDIRLATARNVRLTLTARLGPLNAYAGTRLELADEELIELL